MATVNNPRPPRQRGLLHSILFDPSWVPWLRAVIPLFLGLAALVLIMQGPSAWWLATIFVGSGGLAAFLRWLRK